MGGKGREKLVTKLQSQKSEGNSTTVQQRKRERMCSQGGNLCRIKEKKKPVGGKFIFFPVFTIEVIRAELYLEGSGA